VRPTVIMLPSLMLVKIILITCQAPSCNLMGKARNILCKARNILFDPFLAHGKLTALI
jgi:hypothetical protein